MPVDDQYEHNSGDVIENRLLWPAIQRSDLNSIFTCQALNTDLVDPKETSFVLDMHCKFEKLQNNWLPWLQETIEHHSNAYKNNMKSFIITWLTVFNNVNFCFFLSIIKRSIVWYNVWEKIVHFILYCILFINYVLSIQVKPLTVSILNQPVSLVADRRYEVLCESSGSRPNAIITWYKGKRQLRRTKVSLIIKIYLS